MMLYPARAALKIVTMIDGINQVIIPDCKILGQGMAENSTGIIIADNNRFWYIPLISADLKETLSKMETLCGSLIDVAKTLASNAGDLLDNTTTVTGQATMTPSTIKGEAIKTDATTVQNEATELRTQIQTLANTLA